jgi:hypothetical protein
MKKKLCMNCTIYLLLLIIREWFLISWTRGSRVRIRFKIWIKSHRLSLLLSIYFLCSTYNDIGNSYFTGYNDKGLSEQRIGKFICAPHWRYAGRQPCDCCETLKESRLLATEGGYRSAHDSGGCVAALCRLLGLRAVHCRSVEPESRSDWCPGLHPSSWIKLRPTVSRPVCFGVRHPSGTRDQFFFLLEIFFRQLLACYS